jgi:hypothetical protein
MIEAHRLLTIMGIRLFERRNPLDDTWRTMLKDDPDSDFTAGYVRAFEELNNAINFGGNVNDDPGDYDVGYWYACLVILGLDTTGLGRDE